MLCPHCGAELPDGAQYCGECGGDLTITDGSATTELAPSKHTNALRTNDAGELARNTKIGVAVVVALAAISVVFAIIAVLLLA